MNIDPNDFDYQLPQELIAQEPAEPRDHSRLMIVNREKEDISHQHFYDLPKFLGENDVLVMNQSKVFPGRLRSNAELRMQNAEYKNVEILLLDQVNANTWVAIGRPRLKVGQKVIFSDELEAVCLESDKQTGEIVLQFNQSGTRLLNLIDQLGETPIPPYIEKILSEKELREKYQTVFAKDKGSAAAPTAGLHFTQDLLERLKNKGVQLEYLTLHVGLGTFQPLRDYQIELGKLHAEKFFIDAETANRLNQAKKQGKRIIAVGTTSTRALESSAKMTNDKCQITNKRESTDLFIYPPYDFKFVDAMITNFHLPKTSLLMLVSALASRSLILEAYKQAVEEKYHFFSFGDAMLVV